MTTFRMKNKWIFLIFLLNLWSSMTKNDLYMILFTSNII